MKRLATTQIVLICDQTLAHRATLIPARTISSTVCAQRQISFGAQQRRSGSRHTRDCRRTQSDRTELGRQRSRSFHRGSASRHPRQRTHAASSQSLSNGDLLSNPSNEAAGLLDHGHEDAALRRAEEDARLFHREAQREEKEAWQRQVEDAPHHQDYVPANSWTGLELVGGEAEWDTGRRFHGFIPTAELETNEEITAAVYRAVVEVFAQLGAKRAPRTSRNYSRGPLVNDSQHVLIDVNLSQEEGSEASAVTLKFPSPECETNVLRSGSLGLHEPQDAADGNLDASIAGTLEGAYTASSLRSLIQSWGRSWLEIPLQDPKIKLAILKRITRLTGRRIADPVVHEAKTVSWLIQHLTQPKPLANLHDSVEASMAGLSNVKLLNRRQTPVDKEKERGGWKLIESELLARGLPVFGHRS